MWQITKRRVFGGLQDTVHISSAIKIILCAQKGVCFALTAKQK